jgi:hypothetical protein
MPWYQTETQGASLVFTDYNDYKYLLLTDGENDV